MIICSTRDSFVLQTRGMLTSVPVGIVPVSGPYCCDYLDEAEYHVAHNRDQLLAVDLGSTYRTDDIVEFVQRWQAEWPTYFIVLIAPGSRPDEPALIRLLGPGRDVLRAAECTLPGNWHTIIRAAVVGPLLASMWWDLTTAAKQLGRPIEYPHRVLTLLDQCPSIRRVEEYTRQHQHERRSLKSQLRRAFELRTRTMIYGFRLLWVMRLREEEWTPLHAARFLCYQDSSHAARKLRLFWRLGMRELDRIPYHQVVGETTDWLTGSRGFLARVHSLQDLRTRVIRLSGTPVALVSSSLPGT